MKDQKIEKSLDIILKNGDLHDIISIKEGVKSTRYPILKANLLFLSRILYGGVLIGEKIKQKLAPLQKVKKAQDDIRDILGINIDIVRIKDRNFLDYILFTKGCKDKKCLAVLYQDKEADNETYLSNLIKIRDFGQLYNINYVYLSRRDILNLFDGVDLSYDKTIFLQDLLVTFLDHNDELLLALNITDLKLLIDRLKNLPSYNKDIIDFGENILDPVIKRALDNYLIDKNVVKLKEIVAMRLELLLNSDSVFRDKKGKIYKTIKVCDEFLSITSRRENAELIDKEMVSFLEYLKISDDIDQKELNNIIKLYLFILQKWQNKEKNIEESYSFYDKVYNRYIAKKEKRLKKVKGINSKILAGRKNVLEIGCSFILSFLLCTSILVTGFGIDNIQYYCFKNRDSNIYKNVCGTIIRPYRFFGNIEKEILENVLQNLIGSSDDIKITPEYITTGDILQESEEIKIAKVESLEAEIEIPKYYATGYAQDLIYQEGNLFYIKAYPYEVFSFEVQPSFSISYEINDVIVKNIINDNWNFTDVLYPVGDNFVLTSIVIKDLNSDKKCILWYDQERKSYKLLSDDKRYLMSFIKPEITYYFGISEELNNDFIRNMQVFYTGEQSEEAVKKAIALGLGLDSNASLEEVIQKIKNKTYSKTPIKDAKISSKIKNMNKEEYFKSIASLDSLVCNLAASLVVEYADDLAYVVGYMDNGDGVITSYESHAWAMDNKGNIIDATPTVSKEQETIIKDILSWGIKKNIPIYGLITLISYVIYILFGKKIIFSLKVLNLEKLLSDSCVYGSYAKINEILYGEVSIPRKCSVQEFVEKINWDFISFKREELEDLKERLKEIKDEKLRRNALKIVEAIPFVEENYEEIKRILEK